MRKKESKKEMILNAATSLFAHKEFHLVGMDDVAKKAKVAKGTLYNYFKSKEDLYFSILKTRLNTLVNSLKESYNANENAWNNLKRYIERIHKFMTSNPYFFMILKKEEPILEKKKKIEIKSTIDTLKETIHKVFIKGVKERTFRIETANELVTDLVLSMTDTVIKRDLKYNDKTKAVETFLGFLSTIILVN
ncbi:hypothetical protein DRQ09_07850 [candidate division KSB1 bacterium]|nr:MAG: hypothetical protein DRQ09_07850 [candidate division KSB1 bacterium]